MISSLLLLCVLSICAIHGYIKPFGRPFVQRLHASTSMPPPPVSFHFLNERFPFNHRDINNESSTIPMIEIENPFEAASLRKMLDILLLQGSIAACKYENNIGDDKISAYWIDGYFHSLPVYIQSSTYLKEMFHLKDIRIPIINENIKSKSVNVLDNNLILNNNIELSHVIHPKSICKRLFQLRDSMCETYLEDLSVISLENRYLKRVSLTGDASTNYEEKRLLLPITNNSNNIPNSYRDDNFNRLNQLITVMTLNIFRRHLTDASHVSYINYMIDKTKQKYRVKQADSVSNVTATIDEYYEFYQECDTFYNTTMTPRDLLIEFYNEGERKGLERNDDGTYINKLKIARDIITLRETIADYVGYVLDEKQRENKKNFRDVKKDAINIKYNIDDAYDILSGFNWDLQIISNNVESIAWKQGFKCGELAAQTILLRNSKYDDKNSDIDNSMIAIPSSAIHEEVSTPPSAMVRQVVNNNNENNDDFNPVFGAILM